VSTWYYAIDGEQSGPVSDRELHDLAGNGSLHPTDLVWREGFAGWEPAETVAGLFVETTDAPDGPQPTPLEFADTVVSGLGNDPADAGPADHPQDNVDGSFRTPDELKIPVLVSGVFNLVFAVGLGATGCLIPLAIPLVILAYYEIKLFQKTDDIPTHEFAAEAKSLAIYEIIVGVFNTPTLICGIILIIQGGKYVDPHHVSA